jgi:YbbR domain-containing protein
MNWGLITNEWRLKLLAVGLAVLMLGAVAFSQNPPTTRSLTVPLNYNVQPNVILINPPAKATVFFSGLADTIARVGPDNLIATVDATRALPGSAVKLNVDAKTTVGGNVTVLQPPPIVVQVDTRQVVSLPVQVNAHAQSGWSIDPTKSLAICNGAANPNPCVAHFDGPVSWETGLKAVATLSGVIGTQNIPNLPVQLVNASGVLDLAVRTVPAVAVDVTSVDIHAEAVQGTTSVSVALLEASPSQPPPQGYRVTAVTISPLIVTVSGNPTALARIHNITLPPADLSRNTSDATFTIAIPYPDGVTGSPATATVKYSISPNPPPSPT